MPNTSDESQSQWPLGPKDSAKDIILDHKTFMQEGLSRADDAIKGELRRITQNEKTLGHTNIDIIDMLDGLPLESLSQHVRAELALLQNAKLRSDHRMTKRRHRAYEKTEKFILEFDRFLTAYSGIVGLLNSVDAQYGGIATSTLSLLFSVVRMKSKDEAAIVSAMAHISDRLPDLTVYQRIYLDPELENILSDAYRDVILLAREATMYFQKSNIRRHAHSMANTAKFDIMEQSMRESFSRVRLKCETLLAHRVYELKREVDEIKRDFETIQQHKDMERVAELQSALGLGNYRFDDARSKLQFHREVLRTIFDRDVNRQKFRISDFETCSVSSYWESDKSAVILLSGSNETGVPASELWLSPMAVDLTESLLQSKRFVAFEFCSKESNCTNTMASLIYQILAQNPTVVKCVEDWSYLKQNIDGHRGGRLEGLKAALSRLVSRQTEPVFVILNRPELSTEDDASEYIRRMLAVATETQGVLKVLVVIRTGVWDYQQNRRGIGKSELLHTLCLDQRRI